MQFSEGRAQARLAILAVSALAASAGAAAQAGSGIGATSSVGLQIRASVAERAGVRLPSAKGVPAAGPCVFSTTRSRTFAVMLEPLGSSGERPAAPPFEITAAPAGQACSSNADLGKALAALGKDGSPGPHLLILAPQ